MKVTPETAERERKYPTRAAATVVAGVALAMSGCDSKESGSDGEKGIQEPKTERMPESEIERVPMRTMGVIDPLGDDNRTKGKTPQTEQKKIPEEVVKRVLRRTRTRLEGVVCPNPKGWEDDEED